MRNKQNEKEKGRQKLLKIKNMYGKQQQDQDNVPVEAKHGEGRAGARAPLGQHTVSPLGE